MARITRQPVENDTEKDILIGAIVSDIFLEQTHRILKNYRLIKEPLIRRILSWCVEHYNNYGKAPSRLIHDIFASHQREFDDDTVESMSLILSHINERYIENQNTYADQYYIAKAKKYIEEQSLLALSEEIKGSISTGNIEQARRSLLDYNRIEEVAASGIKPLEDPEFINTVFSSMKQTLIEFPYPALQELFRDVYRGDILAVAGPAKRGKSFLMFQLGYYALYNNLNVAVFSYEMDQDVMGVRLFQNMLGQTRQPTEEVLIPYFDAQNSILYEKIDKTGLEYDETMEFQKQFSRHMDVGKLYFFDHNSCGRRVSDIADALDHIENYEDCKIDVVVIDYDNLLESESGFRGDNYEGLNRIWKDVKAKIAQDRNSLVIFGSQYNKSGAKYEVGPQEASGSSRKFDYASHWVSILQSEAEKRAGIMRLSVLGRHDGFYQSDKVVCLQSLAISRPILDARWMHQIPNYDQVVAAQQAIVDQGMKSEEQEGNGKSNNDRWFKGNKEEG